MPARSHITISPAALERKKPGEPDADVWYCIPLTIPQPGHFQSSFCVDSRRLENLLTHHVRKNHRPS